MICCWADGRGWASRNGGRVRGTTRKKFYQWYPSPNPLPLGEGFLDLSPTAYGRVAVMLRFGTWPTGMRVTSFSDLISITDTEFDCAFAT